MKRNKLTIQRNWIKIDNTFHLMVDVEGEVFYEKFRVYNSGAHATPVIRLNKQLNEYNMIDRIKRRFGVRKVEFI